LILTNNKTARKSKKKLPTRSLVLGDQLLDHADVVGERVLLEGAVNAMATGVLANMF
jgi:hypothetical protein